MLYNKFFWASEKYSSPHLIIFDKKITFSSRSFAEAITFWLSQIQSSCGRSKNRFDLPCLFFYYFFPRKEQKDCQHRQFQLFHPKLTFSHPSIFPPILRKKTIPLSFPETLPTISHIESVVHISRPRSSAPGSEFDKWKCVGNDLIIITNENCFLYRAHCFRTQPGAQPRRYCCTPAQNVLVPLSIAELYSK